MPFSSIPEKDFVDRRETLSLLSGRFLGASERLVPSAFLSAPPGMGKTEVLKQLFGHFFWKQDRIVPFFFTVNPSHLSAKRFAKTYLIQFLSHIFAFKKKQQGLLRSTGMSLDDLSDLATNHSAWVRDIVERYRRSEQDPLDALEIAVTAPSGFALATGTPVAVMIDDFQHLRDLHIEDVADPGLSALFAEPLSSGRAPHLVTGSGPEIQEMALAGRMDRITMPPLGIEDATSIIRTFLGGPGNESLPLPLLRRLGGNPLYLKSIAERVRLHEVRDEASFEEAYINEVMDGAVSCYWASTLKRFVPELEARANALAIFHLIHTSGEPLSLRRVTRHLSLTEAQTAVLLKALHLAGLIRGEFGVFRPVEDRVARDAIEHLYQREVLAESRGSQERTLREQVRSEQEDILQYDLTIPMTKESELVAAQCIEQIGKNLHLHEDTIGQMQVAVIEACINAIEHSKGMDETIAVSVRAGRNRLEVWIEHAGPEFIIQETGEPSTDKVSSTASPRGWGIKVMKRFAEEVRFERTARGTRTILIKNLQTHTAARKEDKSKRG